METEPKPVNIIIADAHIRLAYGIKGCLRNPAYNIICISSEEELTKLPGNDYQLLLFNYKLPHFNFEDTRWHKRFPGLKYVAYSFKPNWQVTELVLNKKLDGYVLENTPRSEIEKCFCNVLNNQNYIDHEITLHLATTPQPPQLFGGNDNEITLYNHVIGGGKIKKIKTGPGRSTSAVHAAKIRIFEKTGAQDETEIILHALYENWIFPEDIPWKKKK